MVSDRCYWLVPLCQVPTLSPKTAVPAALVSATSFPTVFGTKTMRFVFDGESSSLSSQQLRILQTNLAAALGIPVDAVTLQMQAGSIIIVAFVPSYISASAVSFVSTRYNDRTLLTGLESDFTLLSVLASGEFADLCRCHFCCDVWQPWGSPLINGDIGYLPFWFCSHCSTCTADRVSNYR